MCLQVWICLVDAHLPEAYNPEAYNSVAKLEFF